MERTHSKSFLFEETQPISKAAWDAAKPKLDPKAPKAKLSGFPEQLNLELNPHPSGGWVISDEAASPIMFMPDSMKPKFPEGRNIK